MTKRNDEYSISSYTKVPELLGYGMCPNYSALEGDGRDPQPAVFARYCWVFTPSNRLFTIPHSPCFFVAVHAIIKSKGYSYVRIRVPAFVLTLVCSENVLNLDLFGKRKEPTSLCCFRSDCAARREKTPSRSDPIDKLNDCQNEAMTARSPRLSPTSNTTGKFRWIACDRGNVHCHGEALRV